MPVKESSFCRALLEGMKRVNHATHKHEKPPFIFHSKESESKALVRRNIPTVFWEDKYMFPVYFLENGNSLTAECHYDTLDNLRNTIRSTRFVLLRQGIIIFHYNTTLLTVNWTGDWLRF
jgi:hypothetical protein